MRRQWLKVFLCSLCPSQVAKLRLIPKWQRSLRAYWVQCHRDSKAVEQEKQSMAREDLDAESASWRGFVLRRDQHLLENARRQEGTGAQVGFNYYIEHALQRFCPTRQEYRPVIFKVPGMMGCVFPSVPEMASDFYRCAGEISWIGETEGTKPLGLQEIAYHGVREDLASRTSLQPRPCTFSKFAQLAPASSIHLWHYAKHGGTVLGQQAEYVKYLDSVEYIGKVWSPGEVTSRYLYTAADTEHVRFASTARLNATHAPACWRHSCCVCGLAEPEAKVVLRRHGEVCHAWQPGMCVCRYNSEEALRRLFPAVRLDLLPRHVLLHLATSLGLKVQATESQRRLYLRAQRFMTVALAIHSWGPRATDECRTYPATCGDDFCVQSLVELAHFLNLPTERREDVSKCVSRVLDRLPLLKEKLAVGRPEEIDLLYQRCLR